MTEDLSRQHYWTRKMDQAFEFLQAVLEYPVEECGEPLVSLSRAAEEAGVSVRFSDRPFPGGSQERIFRLREGLIPGYLGVARDLEELGLLLRVEDACRTPRMQEQLASAPEIRDRVISLVSWESGRDEPDPDLLQRRLSVLVACHSKTAGHVSGSALDVSVLDASTGGELDRGGAYLELSVRTPMDSPFIDAEAKRNRQAVSDIFARHGFLPYPYEFWHYSSGDVIAELLSGSAHPARYGPMTLIEPPD